MELAETLEVASAPAPAAVLKRSAKPYTQRRVAFYSPDSGLLALDAGPNLARPLVVTLDGLRAADLLGYVANLSERERPRVVFLCGGDAAATTPPTQWWQEPLTSGWTLASWHNAADRRTGVYERDGVTIELRMAAPWFGGVGAALDPEACLFAWKGLLKGVRGAFGDQIALLTTPAQTGLALFEAALPYGVAVPALPDELREHLASVTTQGRRELLPVFTRTIRDLYEVDARWMYAACVSHLPSGPVLRDGGHEYAGHVPGFYLVKATVPATWSHLGLLPDLASLEGHDGGVVYPRRPRKSFWSWASGAEVKLALDCGWRVKIYQRILWPETHQRPDVAKAWISKLRGLRATQQKIGTPVAQLAAGATRHLVIDTIGRFYAREREEHGILPLARIAELPTGAIPHVEGERVLWSRVAPLAPALLKYAHPEWSATVWGRARARLAAQALSYSFGSLVALRTDGIWTTSNPYDLALNDAERTADERPGSWRVKSYLQGPEFWPETEAQLLDLMRRARSDGEE